MTWHAVPLTRDLGVNAGPWDELNKRLLGAHPMLDSLFVGGLLQAFGTGREWLCIKHAGHEAVAMCVLQRGRLGVWRSFLPSQAQIGPTLIGQPSDLQGLAQALPGWVTQIDLLCHDPQFGDLSVPGPLSMAWRHHAVTFGVALEGGFEKYWTERPSQLRKNLRRYERRAQSASAPLVFRIAGHAADMFDAVARYAALEGAGWKGREGTSLANQDQLQFYSRLLGQRANQGAARVYELWAGDRLAASRLVIGSGRVWVILKTTYDESLRDWAPGRLLLYRVLADAFSSWPGGRLEFYTDATADQLAWADEQRSVQHVSVYPNAACKLATGTLRAARRVGRLRQAAMADTQCGLDQVQVLEEPAEMGADFLALLDAAEQQSPQYGADWYRLFAATVMHGSPGARYLTLARAGKPMAVMAVNLGPQLQRLGVHAGALSNYYSTEYQPVLAPTTTGVDLAPVVRTLRHECRAQPVLRFAPMDPQSREYAALQVALRTAGYAVFEYFCHANWYLPVVGSWNDYLARRPGELRATLTRKRKRLLAEGATIEIVAEAGDVERALAAYQQVYARSWKPTEPVPAFMPEFIRLCARRGWLRLGIVWLGEVPIAAQLWVVAHGRAAIYKLAYDEAYKRRAPGTVLTGHLMQHVLDVDRVREVDYLTGDDAYKQQWMTHRRERWGLVAYDLRTVRGSLGALRQWASDTLHRRGRAPANR